MGTLETTLERTLPTGRMHLVFRLSDHPLRVYRGLEDRCPQVLGPAVVGGARANPYLRGASQPSSSVGEVALDAGYADQAHFSREFRELAGIAPSEYRSTAPAQSHHVPVR